MLDGIGERPPHHSCLWNRVWFHLRRLFYLCGFSEANSPQNTIGIVLGFAYMGQFDQGDPFNLLVVNALKFVGPFTFDPAFISFYGSANF